jgi:hypothetical protein
MKHQAEIRIDFLKKSLFISVLMDLRVKFDPVLVIVRSSTISGVNKLT